MEIAEYASLAGSVLGTLVAAATHQMIYSTGPLALALCLNTFNHNRLRKYVTRIPPTVEEFISPLKQEIQESDRVKYSFTLDQLRKTFRGDKPSTF